jgi:hypothetical protein
MNYLYPAVSHFSFSFPEVVSAPKNAFARDGGMRGRMSKNNAYNNFSRAMISTPHI